VELPSFPLYVFMVWCSVKSIGTTLPFYIYVTINVEEPDVCCEGVQRDLKLRETQMNNSNETSETSL